MNTNPREASGTNDDFKNTTPPSETATTSASASESTGRTKKKYHSSAMYAASKWHGTVKYVKSPNAGHGLLPTQL